FRRCRGLWQSVPEANDRSVRGAENRSTQRHAPAAPATGPSYRRPEPTPTGEPRVHRRIAEERRTTDAIVDALAQGGVRHVVGMPGGHAMGLFSALHDHRTIRVVLVREESIGSMAAEAYGRLSGEPVV